MRSKQFFLAVLALVLFLSMQPVAASQQFRLEARLAATAAAPRTSGAARFEQRPDRLRFTTEVEGLRGVSMVVVRVNGQVVGTARVWAGRADLNLDSRSGQRVPVLRIGAAVAVQDAASGAVLLQGSLRAR